jgi:hypothetical protein
MQGSPESFLAQRTWPNTPAQPDVTCKSGTHRGRHVLPGRGSRRFAGLHRRLSRGAWLFASCCRGLSRFGYSFNHGWQFQLGLFRSAMVAMVKRLDAGSFFFLPQLSGSIFLALFFKVCRNRFSCHGQSVAEQAPSRLSNLALYRRSVTREIFTLFATVVVQVGAKRPNTMKAAIVDPGRARLRELFPDGGGGKEVPVPKPFRRSAPNVESDAASVPACWTSDVGTDANQRPA